MTRNDRLIAIQYCLGAMIRQYQVFAILTGGISRDPNFKADKEIVSDIFRLDNTIPFSDMMLLEGAISNYLIMRPTNE